MENPYGHINREPTWIHRLQLAGVFVAGFGGLGLYEWIHLQREGVAETLVALALVLAASTLLPVLGRWIYIAWMGLGVSLGLVTQPIFLLLAYGLLFVPVGLFFRVIGRDRMRRRLLSPRESYWEDYRESDEPSSYFKPY